MATMKIFKADILIISPFVRANDEGLMLRTLALKLFTVAYLHFLIKPKLSCFTLTEAAPQFL